MKASGLSARQIAASVGTARSTVGECLRRAQEAGITWPLVETLDETALERRLYPPPAPSTTPRAAPDFATIHQELRAKGVTLFLLWQEYQAREPDGYQYSRFCDLYREWCGKLDLVMRQVHRAGEKLFIDYAGPTLPVDAITGDRALVAQLATGQWLREHHNVLITGFAGVGKPYIACALAQQACRLGFPARYERLPRLVEELAVARADGRYAKLLASLAKIDVLAIDDWGLAPLSAEGRRDLLEILDDRHQLKSTIDASPNP